MKSLKYAFLLLVLTAPAFAQKISLLPAVPSTPTGSELIPCVQNLKTYACTSSQLGVYIRTPSEIAAGVTPVNYGYSADPENILRFGTNTTPGTTDMTVALENAIAALPANGGRVILPAGQYLISSTIIITKHVILEGDGDESLGTTGAATVLDKASSLHGPLFEIEGDNSIVENFYINGISGNTDNGIDVLAHSVTVRNVGVTGVGQDGIRIGDDAGTYNANSWRLDTVTSRSNGRYGIYVDSDSSAASWSVASPNANGGEASNVFVALNGSDGVYEYSAGANTFIGGVYESNGGAGIHIGGWAQWMVFYGGDANESNTGGDVLIDAGASGNPQGNQFVGPDFGVFTDNSTGSEPTVIETINKFQIPMPLTVTGAGGIAVGAPTGGAKGNGTINATGYYANGIQTTNNVGMTILPTYTVGTLPTCGATYKGGMAYVTDATSPTYNGALTGGGSTVVPVFCSGSSWTAH